MLLRNILTKHARDIPHALRQRLTLSYGESISSEIVDALANKPPIHAVRVNAHRILNRRLPDSSLVPDYSPPKHDGVQSWLQFRLAFGAVLAYAVDEVKTQRVGSTAFAGKDRTAAYTAPGSVRLCPVRLEELVRRNGSLLPIPWNPDQGFVLSHAKPSFHIDPLYYAAGLYYAQDASSQLLAIAAPDLFNFAADHNSATQGIEGETPYPVNGDRSVPDNGPAILDMCAAPGGKTTLLQQGLVGNGLLVAVEVDRSRALRLAEVVALQADPRANVVVLHGSALDLVYSKFAQGEPPEKGHSQTAAQASTADKRGFDFILLDAPCSGTALLRREPQALEVWSQRLVRERGKLQRQLLKAAIQLVSRHQHSLSRLVYMTCAMDKNENDGALQYIWTRLMGKKRRDKGLDADEEDDIEKWEPPKEEHEHTLQVQKYQFHGVTRPWKELIVSSSLNPILQKDEERESIRPLQLSVLERNHQSWGISKTPQGYHSFPSHTLGEGGFIGGIEFGGNVSRKPPSSNHASISSSGGEPDLQAQVEFCLEQSVRVGDSDYYLASPTLARLITHCWLNPTQVVIPSEELFHSLRLGDVTFDENFVKEMDGLSPAPNGVALLLRWDPRETLRLSEYSTSPRTKRRKIKESTGAVYEGESEAKAGVYAVSYKQLGRIHSILLAASSQRTVPRVLELGMRLGTISFGLASLGYVAHSYLRGTRAHVPSAGSIKLKREILRFLPSHSLALCSPDLLAPVRTSLHIPLNLFDAMRTMTTSGMVPSELDHALKHSFELEGVGGELTLEDVLSSVERMVLYNADRSDPQMQDKDSSPRTSSRGLKGFPISLTGHALSEALELIPGSSAPPDAAGVGPRVLHSSGHFVPLCSTGLTAGASTPPTQLHKQLLKEGDNIRLASHNGYPIGWLQRYVLRPAGQSPIAVWASLFPSNRQLVRMQLPTSNLENDKTDSSIDQL